MIRLDLDPLGIADLVAVARDGATVELTAAARERMAPARAVVERLDAESRPVYGVTTGFGALADKAIAPEQRAQLQTSLVRSHAAGVGPVLDAEVVRGMLLLRGRSLSAGHSGVRPQLVEAIVALLNAGITPWVPAHGSLGASGDLAPLAHAALPLLGEGAVIGGDGSRSDASVALSERGIEPIALTVKEGLGLINGTEGMTALLGLAVHDIAALLVAADCIAAMSLEALLGTPAPFAEAIVALRPSPGQQESAANLRAMLDGSPMVASHRESHHAVQDPYSLRCIPQVHGAARDVIAFARTTVEREMTSVVDNPIVLVDEGELASTGNFHGQALAYAADMLASVCADVAAISERRVNRLLDPARSRRLPAFLVREPGLNSGLMIAQYTAAGMVSALRQQAAPFAVQSLDTSAGQEDHVSMGFEAAMRTRRGVAMLRGCLAIEAMCAAQALDLRAPLQPAAGTRAMRDTLRESVEFLERDRVLNRDIERAAQWVAKGAWRDAVTAVAGGLR
jgi:histidine ammonia-lyase